MVSSTTTLGLGTSASTMNESYATSTMAPFDDVTTESSGTTGSNVTASSESDDVALGEDPEYYDCASSVTLASQVASLFSVSGLIVGVSVAGGVVVILVVFSVVWVVCRRRQ